MVKRLERGWAGHFICCHQCLFRRNTLLTSGRRHIVVSTVGAMYPNLNRSAPDGPKGKIDTIGYERYYETAVFRGKRDGLYMEADTHHGCNFEGEWGIFGKSEDDLPEDVDNLANKIHEKAVDYCIKHFDEVWKTGRRA